MFIFQETKSPKKLFISGNGNPEKILIFQERGLRNTLGNRTFLYFRKSICRTIAYLELEVYSEP